MYVELPPADQRPDSLQQIPLFVNGFRPRDCHALLVLYAGTANYMDDSTHTISEELLLQIRRVLEFLYALWVHHDSSMRDLYDQWRGRIVNITEYRRLATIQDQSDQLATLSAWIANIQATRVRVIHRTRSWGTE